MKQPLFFIAILIGLWYARKYGREAVAKINAGASLVQLYSGLIYRGPELVQECVQALAGVQPA